MSQVATLQLNVTGYGQPAYAETLEFPFSASPLSIQRAYAFSTGFQTITKPSGAKGVIITNLSANGTLTIKGVTGDTGYEIDEGDVDDFPLCIPVETALTVTASAALTADLRWI